MKRCEVSLPHVMLFGVRVHAASMSEALDVVDAAIARRAALQIGVVNAAKVVNMQRMPMLRDDVLASDLILADGIAVVWAGRALGQRLPERVTGIDLMAGMLERGSRNAYSVYLLGAEEEVSARVEAQIRRLYPGVRIAGRHHGYFRPEEEQQLVDGIAATHPDILLVAMTSPKKEKFMARWGERLGVPVCHGVGGSFDVLAGKVERAPPSWQRLGLEWAYRLKQEPGRLWRRYLTTNTLFCGMLLAEMWRRLWPGGAPGRGGRA
ncbi:MAG: WecB/TagA/CpsF family glycosyltransferase [Gammaproteobacteria bacterium]|nr:WecB/TagA/CpsF family glycosyltransferase [Gammaproteobacteria bacterium]